MNKIKITLKYDNGLDKYNLDPIGDNIERQYLLSPFFTDPNYGIPRAHFCTDGKNFLNSSIATQLNHSGVINTDPNTLWDFSLIEDKSTEKLSLLFGETGSLPEGSKYKVTSVTTRETPTTNVYFHSGDLSHTVAQRAKDVCRGFSSELIQTNHDDGCQSYSDELISISEHIHTSPDIHLNIRVAVKPSEIFVWPGGLLEIPLL